MELICRDCGHEFDDIDLFEVECSRCGSTDIIDYETWENNQREEHRALRLEEEELDRKMKGKNG